MKWGSTSHSAWLKIYVIALEKAEKEMTKYGLARWNYRCTQVGYTAKQISIASFEDNLLPFRRNRDAHSSWLWCPISALLPGIMWHLLAVSILHHDAIIANMDHRLYTEYKGGSMEHDGRKIRSTGDPSGKVCLNHFKTNLYGNSSCQWWFDRTIVENCPISSKINSYSFKENWWLVFQIGEGIEEG